MRKLLAITLCILVCACFSACNIHEDNPPEYVLRENMSAKDIFDTLTDANSFSVQMGDCDYRMLKTEGYSIKEEGGFEAYFVLDDVVYHVIDNEQGLSVQTSPLSQDYFDMVESVYMQYVGHVRASYGVVPRDDVQLDVQIENGEAIVKVISTDTDGVLSIKKCRLFDINSSHIELPTTLDNIKLAAQSSAN